MGSTLRTILLIVPIVLGVAGCDEPKIVRAWPGMSATEFNRLNRQLEQPLKTDDLAWIGVSTPVTLVLPKAFSGQHIATTMRGAGIQVFSSATSSTGRTLARPIVQILDFSIGPGLERIADTRPLVLSYCAALADAAGVARVAVPTPAEISKRLTRQYSDTTLCAGSGRTMAFQINAARPFNHWLYGNDNTRAYLSGVLTIPDAPDAE